MKRAFFVCLFLCLTTTFLLSQSNPVPVIQQSAKVASSVSTPQTDPKAQARILGSYGKLPLSFEANHGQTDGRVKFLSRSGGYSLFLTGDEAVLALRGKKAKNTAPKRPTSSPVETRLAASADRMTGGVLRMKLRNANAAAKVTGVDELPGTSNYFIGNDPAKWRTNVPTYAKVKYEGIYSGIDLVYYGNQRQLEYDFIVAPGADPRRIQFDVRGARRIRQDAQGELVFKVGEDEIRWHKPVAYQEKNGTRQEITARYALTNANLVAFEVAKYDPNRPLYIDPLIYSTYLGGSSDDDGYGIAVDSAGNAYVTGQTSSTDFPTTNPLQPANAGGNDVFVAKINPTGSALVYSTYLGGSGNDGNGWGHIAVDSTGNAYVTGWTESTDFPTVNPLQAAYGGGGDAFVAKINPTGSALVYSTYLGGSSYDGGFGIAVDGAGNAYVACQTSSTDFPTANPLQPTYGGGSDDAAVAEINPTGSALVYSTYLGGSGADYAQGIALDSAGNAYVVGQTYSTDFPTTPGAFQTICGDAGCTAGDAFVTKLNPAGSALVYSTYLGGNSMDWGGGIAVDGEGDAYVTGQTYSTNFPTMNPLQQNYAGGPGDAFVTKLNPAGSALVYSTYLGGWLMDWGGGIAVDITGNAYVTGFTMSGNFPTMNPLQGCGGYWDAFVSKFNPTGSALVYSTCLGGTDADWGLAIAVDSAGNAYVTGYTDSTNFPTENPLQPANGGGNDAFVAKLNIAAVTTTALSSSPNPSPYGQAVTFTAVVASSAAAPPDGEIVTFNKGTTVLGTGVLSGGSASFTTSALPAGTKTIKAVYGGDSNFAASTSKAVSQVVNKATTTTTLASSLNPSKSGQSVTFTASVTPQFSGTVTRPVTFYDGTTALKTVALSGGAAKFTTSTLTSGTHSITAVYGGNSNFSGSTSAPVNQVVLVATTTMLSSSLNPSIYGQAVTFTATVTSTMGTPPPDGETVSFMKGTTVLGTGTLSGGSASFTSSTLPVGTNAIKAVYSGDSNLPGSTSKAVSQVVSKATTTTALASSLNPSNVGQSVTFTARVTPQFSGTVTGPVTFYDGTTVLKTVGLSGGVAKFTTSTLTSGTHTITATYNGNASFSGSSASLTQTVN